jgi:membrane protein DedA with SNARE-associated domain
VFEPLIEYFQGSPVELLSLLSVLILCGMGLPIPEDIILLATGMIAQETGRSWILASIVMYAGVLAGDSIAFLIGRRFGIRMLALPWIQRVLSPKKQRRIAALFHQYGSTVFFVARFLPGLRAAIFCTAGAMRARYLHFLFFDGTAALISVPFFVWLG